MKRTEEEIQEWKEEMKQDAKQEARMEFNMYDDEDYCAEMLGIREAIDDLRELAKKYESYGHTFDCKDWM